MLQEAQTKHQQQSAAVQEKEISLQEMSEHLEVVKGDMASTLAFLESQLVDRA